MRRAVAAIERCRHIDPPARQVDGPGPDSPRAGAAERCIGGADNPARDGEISRQIRRRFAEGLKQDAGKAAGMTQFLDFFPELPLSLDNAFAVRQKWAGKFTSSSPL